MKKSSYNFSVQYLIFQAVMACSGHGIFAFKAGRKRPGQTAVEYLLMLALIAGMTMLFLMLFHRRLLGGFFTLVGMIIGASTSQTTS
ncbi:MAG: hypothetical protein HY746_07015 [Elusimicrobia bacterium]|nr:hypothetical protein [Elusimicrobiota bacterium]